MGHTLPEGTPLQNRPLRALFHYLTLPNYPLPDRD